MIRSRAGGLALALALSAGLSAQGDIIVDAAGGGDYTEIQAAVDAAPVGATIRIRHGLYLPVSISKGLRLLGDPQGPLADDSVRMDGGINIVDLPATESLVMTDIGGGLGIGAYSYTLERCRGQVFLAFLRGGLQATDCDALVMDRCFGNFDFVRSQTELNRCSAFGISRALVAESSDLTLVSCSVSVIGYWGSVEHAAIVKGGCFVYSSDSRFFPSCAPWFGPCGLAIAASAGAQVRKHEDPLLFLVDETAIDRFSLELQSPITPEYVFLGASLASRPWHMPEGRVYLDPTSFQLIYAGAVQTGTPMIKELMLTPEFRPNYRMRPQVSDPAPSGSRALGLPVTFQAAIIENGKLLLSLPYTLVY